MDILGVGPASLYSRAGNSFEINVLTESGQAPTAGAIFTSKWININKFSDMSLRSAHI